MGGAGAQKEQKAEEQVPAEEESPLAVVVQPMLPMARMRRPLRRATVTVLRPTQPRTQMGILMGASPAAQRGIMAPLLPPHILPRAHTVYYGLSHILQSIYHLYSRQGKEESISIICIAFVSFLSLRTKPFLYVHYISLSCL